MLLWLEYLTLSQGRSILGLERQKWYRFQSSLHFQIPKYEVRCLLLRKARFAGPPCWSRWWPALNLPSDAPFSRGTVCLLSLLHCRELNMPLIFFFFLPLIFICAVKTASTCIPLREIAKINAGLTYTKWRNKQKYLFLCPQTTVPPEGEYKLAATPWNSKSASAASVKARAERVHVFLYMRELYAKT